MEGVQSRLHFLLFCELKVLRLRLVWHLRSHSQMEEVFFIEIFDDVEVAVPNSDMNRLTFPKIKLVEAVRDDLALCSNDG